MKAQPGGGVSFTSYMPIAAYFSTQTYDTSGKLINQKGEVFCQQKPEAANSDFSVFGIINHRTAERQKFFKPVYESWKFVRSGNTMTAARSRNASDNGASVRFKIPSTGYGSLAEVGSMFVTNTKNNAFMKCSSFLAALFYGVCIYQTAQAQSPGLRFNQIWMATSQSNCLARARQGLAYGQYQITGQGDWWLASTNLTTRTALCVSCIAVGSQTQAYVSAAGPSDPLASQWVDYLVKYMAGQPSTLPAITAVSGQASPITLRFNQAWVATSQAACLAKARQGLANGQYQITGQGDWWLASSSQTARTALCVSCITVGSQTQAYVTAASPSDPLASQWVDYLVKYMASGQSPVQPPVNNGGGCPRSITYGLSIVPNSARVGQTVKVRYIYPGDKPGDGDWIGCFYPTTKQSYTGLWTYLTKVRGCEYDFIVPNINPGPMQFRYILDGGYDKITATAEFVVLP